ncbi:MAG: hypothetical protein WBG39_01915, partial [Gordonia sp. (in: high G+C Gram-positive bacteria)]
ALVVGLRYIAWNPLGRAIAGYLAGLLVVVAILLANPSSTDPTNPWWAIAIIILSLACCSVMIESWFSASAVLRQTSALWNTLLASHPELVEADYQSTVTVLKADDRVSQILDGLYLHAGAGLVPMGNIDTELSPQARAQTIAGWLRGPEGPPVESDLLTTPPGLSDRRWVRMIASEYDRAASTTT